MAQIIYRANFSKKKSTEALRPYHKWMETYIKYHGRIITNY